MMFRILSCRAFILIPIFLILVCVSVVLLARWIHEKKISPKSKTISIIVMVCTILCGYFMFLHGNLRKTVVDLDACARSFNAILALDFEKQDKPYFASPNGESDYIHIKDGNLDMQIHVIYGEMDSSFDVTKTSSNAFEVVFAPLFAREKKDGDILCVASAMHACREEWFNVHAFNGCYNGTIYMCKNNVHIVIDYSVSDEQKLYYAFTTEKPDKLDISQYFV